MVGRFAGAVESDVEQRVVASSTKTTALRPPCRSSTRDTTRSPRSFACAGTKLAGATVSVPTRCNTQPAAPPAACRTRRRRSATRRGCRTDARGGRGLGDHLVRRHRPLPTLRATTDASLVRNRTVSDLGAASVSTISADYSRVPEGDWDRHTAYRVAAGVGGRAPGTARRGEALTRARDALAKRRRIRGWPLTRSTSSTGPGARRACLTCSRGAASLIVYRCPRPGVVNWPEGGCRAAR